MSLLSLVRHHAPQQEGVVETAISGLVLMRATQSNLPRHIEYKPSLCIVLEGAKEVMYGDTPLGYGPGRALLVNIEMPLLSRIVRAPYVGLSLGFDVALMREIVPQLPPLSQGREVPPGLFVGRFEGALADAVERLVGLLDRPEAIPVLAPTILREIYYWLLTGPDGDEIARLALPDSHTQRLATAISMLRSDISRTIRIDELASAARMSISSFHQHFKTLTAMTPLQYQKQLRLLEARRLMLAGGINVANAAYRVGYESVSQFSREYARAFGTPPKRHVAELRDAPPV